MIQHQPVQPSIHAQRKLDDLLANFWFGEVHGHDLHAGAELLLEFLKGILAAGYGDDVRAVWIREEVRGDGVAEA